jgi:pyridoxal phosphate enzyme (YggS family)
LFAQELVEKKILQNIQEVESDIKKINKNSNLIIVTKYASIEQITPVLEYGHCRFGENKIQDSKQKWLALKEKYPETELHFIGHLQKNKAKEAVKIFDYIHTLDNVDLAKELSKEMDKQNKFPQIFIQVNIGQESQKSGVDPSEVNNFIKKVSEECNIKVSGLMCIPPKDKNASLYFALLKKIAKENKIQYLSMGMSADYKTAAKMGASFVRVGSRIFV